VNKPFSESAEQNKYAIAEVLKTAFADRRKVLELASGTGQHAVYFGKLFPHLVWQPSDLPESLLGIRAWVESASLFNVKMPIALDVEEAPWPPCDADAIFSANSVHIISLAATERMFAGIGRVLKGGGLCALYGPFNYGGLFTSESNRLFDEWLRSRDPESGVKDFECIDALAGGAGLDLVEDFKMPANNRLLLWRKAESPA
jgi:SAM-dependent methyltransferase